MLASLSPPALGVAFSSSTASQPQRRKFLKLTCKSNSNDNDQVCFSFFIDFAFIFEVIIRTEVLLLTKFHLGEFYLSKLINFQSFQRSPKACYRILAIHQTHLQRLYIFQTYCLSHIHRLIRAFLYNIVAGLSDRCSCFSWRWLFLQRRCYSSVFFLF